MKLEKRYQRKPKNRHRRKNGKLFRTRVKNFDVCPLPVSMLVEEAYHNQSIGRVIAKCKIRTRIRICPRR